MPVREATKRNVVLLRFAYESRGASFFPELQSSWALSRVEYSTRRCMVCVGFIFEPDRPDPCKKRRARYSLRGQKKESREDMRPEAKTESTPPNESTLHTSPNTAVIYTSIARGHLPPYCGSRRGVQPPSRRSKRIFALFFSRRP